jgi:hypothetical protein
MATQNTTLTGSWKKVANDSDEVVLIQSLTNFEYAVAAVTVDEPPTVYGHPIRSPLRGISRDMIGPGFLYAKVIYGNEPELLVVSGSSVELAVD